MKTIKRSTIIGLMVYAGFSFAGYLASTGHVWTAYSVIFVTCSVSVIVDRLLTSDNCNRPIESAYGDDEAGDYYRRGA